MRLHYLRGDRAAALLAFDRCERTPQGRGRNPAVRRDAGACCDDRAGASAPLDRRARRCRFGPEAAPADRPRRRDERELARGLGRQTHVRRHRPGRVGQEPPARRLRPRRAEGVLDPARARPATTRCRWPPLGAAGRIGWANAGRRSARLPAYSRFMTLHLRTGRGPAADAPSRWRRSCADLLLRGLSSAGPPWPGARRPAVRRRRQRRTAWQELLDCGARSSPALRLRLASRRRSAAALRIASPGRAQRCRRRAVAALAVAGRCSPSSSRWRFRSVDAARRGRAGAGSAATPAPARDRSATRSRSMASSSADRLEAPARVTELLGAAPRCALAEPMASSSSASPRSPAATSIPSWPAAGEPARRSRAGRLPGTRSSARACSTRAASCTT